MKLSKRHPLHSLTPRWPLTSLALGAFIMLGGCGEDNLTPEQHIQKAKEFAAQGKAAEAQIELRNAIQKEPSNSQAHVLQADMYMRVGNPFIAETVLKKARESGVPAEAIKVEMARSLMMQGRLDDALKAAQTGGNDSIQNQQLLLDVQSRILLAMGKVQESCGKAQEAYQKQPDSVSALHGMSRCALAVDKDANKAESLLRTALEKDPGNAQTLVQLGRLAQSRNKPKEAMEFYRQVLKLDPMQVQTRISLANMLVDAKQHDEARKILQEGGRVSANPGLVELQAKIEFQLGRFTQARDLLAKLLKDNPDYQPGVLLNGLTAYVLGNDEQAAKDLSRYLGQDADHKLARRSLAAAQLRMGQTDLVIQTLAPLTSGSAIDPEAMGLLGQAYLADGDYAKAIATLQKSPASKSGSSMPQVLLGMSYLASGSDEQGVAALTEAARKDPRSTQAESLLIAHHMDRGAYDKALGVIAELDKKRPNDASVLNQRGLALLGKKDFVAARAQFAKALELKPAYYPAVSGLARLDVLMNKDYGAARKRFEALLAIDKTNLQATLALANVVKMQGNVKEYVALMGKAIEAHKDNIEPSFALWQHQMASREYKKALTLANETHTRLPQSSVALDMLAQAQLASGEKDNALASYHKLANQNPKNAQAQLTLGLLLAELKKFAPAREALAKAVALNPTDPTAYEVMAMLMLSQGKASEALQVARQLGKQSPGAGYGLEGDVFFRQQQFKEAGLAYGKAFSISRNSKTLLRLHEARVRAGDAQGADKQVMAWLAANPKDSAVRGQWASSLAQRGADQDAVRQFEYLVAENPKNAFALNDLAWVYGKLNDPRALPTAERAVQLHEGNPLFLDTLGMLQLKSGQVEKAVKSLERAAGSSKVPSIDLHYAQVLIRAGDKAKARDELEGLIKMFPNASQVAEAKTLLAQVR